MMKDEIKASLDTLFKVKWGDELIESSWMKFLGKQWRRGQDCVRVRVPSTYFKKILDDHHLMWVPIVVDAVYATRRL